MENHRCAECEHLRRDRRGCAARYYFFCNHGNAEVVFNSICHDSNRMPGFIGWSRPGEYYPIIKKSPKWCPLRESNREEIQYEE